MLGKLFNKIVYRYNEQPGKRGSFFFKESRSDGLGTPWQERWQPVARLLPLKSSDEVLDIGCAEGLIALDIASRVAAVRGIDVLPERAERARQNAACQGIGHATFAQGSIVDVELSAKRYDVVLFMSVMLVPIGGGRHIGLDELKKAVDACRELIVVRVNVQDDPRSGNLLKEIFDLLREKGFNAVAFPRMRGGDGILYDNIIIGVKQGSDRKLPEVYELALVPVANTNIPFIDNAKLIPWSESFGKGEA